MGWFEVDKKGLRALVANRPKGFILRELLQNAWDEPGVTKVEVFTSQSAGMAVIEVIDDAPEGFYDLSHAFTFFADTRKRKDPTKRGRFNAGEKEVLALAESAQITTTKGGFIFLKDGTRKKTRQAREAGSAIGLKVKMNKQEYKQMLAEVKTYLPPKNILTIVNGEELWPREPYCSIMAKLPTEFLNEEGILRKTVRLAAIDVHKVKDGETAMLYEMGLPVCETGDQYHYDIQQRVPLDHKRDNVPASFLRAVRGEVANVVIYEVEEEEASANWVRDAMSSNRVNKQAVTEALTKRLGRNLAVPTPGDQDSQVLAQLNGYRMVRPSELSKEEWENARKAGCIPATTQLFPPENREEVVLVNYKQVAERAVKLLLNMEVYTDEVRAFMNWLNGLRWDERTN